MRYSRFLLSLLLVFLVALLTASLTPDAFAQDRPYIQNPIPPMPDPMHFPSGSDLQTFQQTLETLQDFDDNKQLGQNIGNDFSTSGNQYNNGQYRPHPWKGGRNVFESEIDWFLDSTDAVGLWPLADLNMMDFLECFEPRLVFPVSPFCWPPVVRPTYCGEKRNLGYIWEYWWPEWEIETNNIGISAFNPIVEGRVDLLHPYVAQLLETIFRPIAENYVKTILPLKILPQIGGGNGSMPDAEFPDELREEPRVAQQHWAGLLPGDQTLVQEAHVYRSMVAQITSEARCKGCGQWGINWKKLKFFCVPTLFWYNGYKKGNKECFYDTLPPERGIVANWSEEFLPSQHPQNVPASWFWRIPDMSALLGDRSPELYMASVPAMIDDTYYWQTRSCSSYRVQQWPGIYGDLTLAAGVLGMSSAPLSDICYKGGEQLYPVMGTLMGQFNPLTSAAFFSRRAIELSSEILREESFSGDFPFVWVDIYTGVPYFADKDRGGDSIDKLQRVYPKPSKCFQVQQIMERSNLFPANAERPDQLGSIRYLYWNKRIASTCEYRGVVDAAEKVRALTPPFQPGWGCQRFPPDWAPNEEISRGHFFEGDLWGLIPPPSSLGIPIFPPWAESAGPQYTWPYIQDALGGL